MFVLCGMKYQFATSLALLVFGVQAQPYAVGNLNIAFYDAERDRSIGCEVHYPATEAGDDTPVNDGEYPVLVIGHGFVMGTDAYTYLWQHYAPLGYIVVLPFTEAGFAPDHQAFGEDLAFLAADLQAAQQALAAAQVSSLAVCVNPGSAFNCYWEMPFRTGFKITMTNIAAQEMTLYYQINYTLTEVPADAAYFHAQFRRTNPLPYKGVYTILDGVRGRGHYVGVYMAWGVNNCGWWGEGEIKFYICLLYTSDAADE